MGRLQRRLFLATPACSKTFLPIQSRNIWKHLCVVAALFAALIQPSMQCQVPEYFGVYAVVDGKLVSVIGGKGNFTPERAMIHAFDYKDMSAENGPVMDLHGSDIRFQVFDVAVADTSAGVELYKLPYVRNLISQADAVVSLLGQVTNRPQGNTASPMGSYLVAKTDALKVELLQKPVPGQPQMIQLVPESKLTPGVYGLFSLRHQGIEGMTISAQIFKWNGQMATPFCIDVLRTAGLGGAIDDSDRQMEHPYYLAKNKYVTCTGSSLASSPQSATSMGGQATGQNAPAAACSSYNDCFGSGISAYQRNDWLGAMAAFQAAADKDPAQGEPYVWLGRAALAAGGSSNRQLLLLSRYWDKALALGDALRIAACHQKTFTPCERGDLVLSTKSFAFIAASGSHVIFSAKPSDLTPGRAISYSVPEHVSYNIKIGKKNYDIDFVPSNSATCKFDVVIQCPPEGTEEQLVLAQYVSQTVPKLINGTLGATPPSIPVSSSATGTASSPMRACDRAIDSGYVIRLENHIYKVRHTGTTGSEERLYFFDEKGTQVTDSSLLTQLASAVWTHDNVIASPDARNGSTRVSDILGTSQAIVRYSTVQDILARAMVEAIEAGFTNGATLSEAVPRLTLGTLKSQLMNSPKLILILAAQRGLEASLTAYNQMGSVPLPPPSATALKATDLELIKGYYLQARSLELPYEALAAKLMPQRGSDLANQALRSALNEILSGPLFAGRSLSEALTLKDLLDLEKSIADLHTSLPSLQAFHQNMVLVTDLTNANNKSIQKWASAAAQQCN